VALVGAIQCRVERTCIEDQRHEGGSNSSSRSSLARSDVSV
jgi:hypothetical protein